MINISKILQLVPSLETDINKLGQELIRNYVVTLKKIFIWQKKLWKEKDCPGSLITGIKVWKEPHFSILRIDCTLDVTSSECERIFSV